jgi:TolA-binding protein
LAPQALYNLAFGELDAREYDAAVKDAQAFLDKYKEHRLTGDVEYVRAESQLLANKLDEAEKNYQASRRTPWDSHRDAGLWRVRWALAQFLAKKYDAVVATLAKTEGLAPPELLAEAHYLVGASRYYTEKYAAAIDAFDASLKSAPKWRQADETLLAALALPGEARPDRRRQGRDSQAAGGSYPRASCSIRPIIVWASTPTAGTTFAGAIAAYEVVTSKYPESTFAPYAWYGKGWSLSRTKQYPQAAAAFTSLSRINGPSMRIAERTRSTAAVWRDAKSGDVKGADHGLWTPISASNPPDGGEVERSVRTGFGASRRPGLCRGGRYFRRAC